MGSSDDTVISSNYLKHRSLCKESNYYIALAMPLTSWDNSALCRILEDKNQFIQIIVFTYDLGEIQIVQGQQ